MKFISAFFLAACLGSCVPPPPGGVVGHRSAYPAAGARPAGVGAYQRAKPADRPIQPGETSSAYRLRLARQQRDAIPDAQAIYQHQQADAWGRSSQTGIYRSTGGVTEEVHIGNQPVPVLPGQLPYSRPTYQGGYVPPGTTAVYDPHTGRFIPVRR